MSSTHISCKCYLLTRPYPRKRFRDLNHFVRHRMGQHLRRRSQRGWRARPGVSLDAHLEHMGLVAL
jgi:hypothetical protein